MKYCWLFSRYLASFANGDAYVDFIAGENTEQISHLRSVDVLAVETLPNLHSSYVPKGQARSEFCASRR